MCPFLDEHFMFKKVHEEQLKTKTYVNTRKTDLSKLLGRIDDPHNVLKERLISASEIKLDLSLSTSVLCQKKCFEVVKSCNCCFARK